MLHDCGTYMEILYLIPPCFVCLHYIRDACLSLQKYKLSCKVVIFFVHLRRKVSETNSLLFLLLSRIYHWQTGILNVPQKKKSLSNFLQSSLADDFMPILCISIFPMVKFSNSIRKSYMCFLQLLSACR